MKKLLHERLREAADCEHDDLYASNVICADYGMRTCASVSAEATLFRELADEIEKYYIPRPRFDDGEPVQFGDKYKWADETIRKITGFGVTEEGAPYVTCAFDGLGMSDAMIYSRRLKRPEPKVLDADGVEINVGDVVWPINNPEMKMTVDNFQRIYGQDVTVNCEFEGEFYNFNPNKLTHREPDSLEKLRNDMAEYKTDTHFAEIKTKHTFGEFIDRLTAIMERDA